MNTMVPTSHVGFREAYSPSPHSHRREVASKNSFRRIENNKPKSMTKVTMTNDGVRPVPVDLLEGVLRCRACIIEGIKNDIFQEFVEKFGLAGKSADIERFVHKGCLGYKTFLAFCNSRFKADQLLGVVAFDDLERLSTDYKTFMTTFHEILTCRIDVKASNLTDLMEAMVHEGPIITLHDTDIAALKELHDMYWGHQGPVELP
jgi:hypothetical protein